MVYFWNSRLIFKSLGKVLLYSSFTFLIPILLSVLFKEGVFVTFKYIYVFLLTFLIGFLLSKIKYPKNSFGLTTSQALIVVCLVWLFYVFFASLPFYLLSELNLLNSYFEAMSSITTTGLTIFSKLPALKSILFWRAFLSWIGGLGIVILAYYGITKGTLTTSNKLVQAEGHERLRPSIKKTIFDMWGIYLGLTIIGVIFLFIFGMSLFDSFTYSMSAISTTGSESNPLTLGVIGNPMIFVTLIILMILGSTSFILHYSVIKKKSILYYLKDKQFLYMLLIIFISFLFVYFKLNIKHSLLAILMTVVSVVTCGGFTTFSSSYLLNIAPSIFLLFLILMIIGGSTNSTTGGIKVNRFILFIKSIFWKIKKSSLPAIAHFSKKYNNEIIDNDMIRNLYFFILIYLIFILLGVFILTTSGYGIKESLFEVISAQGNVGLTTGISKNMSTIPKVMLILNMWVGRLEIIPILSIIGIFFKKRGY